MFKLCPNEEYESIWDSLITESPDKQEILGSREHDQIQEKNSTHGPRSAMATEAWGGWGTGQKDLISTYFVWDFQPSEL